jgi:hypothetical protein
LPEQGDNQGEKGRKNLMAAAVAIAVARGRQNSRQRAVFVQAVQKSDKYGKSATAKQAGTEHAVFRPKYKQSDENPKGYVTLTTTIHKKPPMFRRRGM